MTFSQGFRNEFQKVLGVASLFLEQMKSWALLCSAILSLHFAKFPSGARGAELSCAELRRPQHAGAGERVCMCRGMWWAEGPSGWDLHPCIPSSLHLCIPTCLHPCIPPSLPPRSPGRLCCSQLIQTPCHSSQLDCAAGSPVASYCSGQLCHVQPWHLLALDQSYTFTEFFPFLVINGENLSHNYFPHQPPVRSHRAGRSPAAPSPLPRCAGEAQTDAGTGDRTARPRPLARERVPWHCWGPVHNEGESLSLFPRARGCCCPVFGMLLPCF